MNAIALVIGNSNYEYARPDFMLDNPYNDATGVAETLNNLGFVVRLKLDLSEKEFNNELQLYGNELNKYDHCLVYFAGHAVQIDGLNYLAAIDTSFADESSAKYSSVELNLILDYLQKCSCKVKIVILDACRNNPFKQRGFSDIGLAPVKAPTGTLIAYSTSPGERAKDAGIGNNSIYTGALLKHISDKNIPIEEMFKRVRTTVYSLSQGKQISWEHTSLIGDFCFNSGQLIHSIDLPYALEVVADEKYEGNGSEFSKVIQAFKSYRWNTQNSAFTLLSKIDRSTITKDERFLLGRNILQSADGGEFKSISILEDLGKFLNQWMDGKENHVLNGILYEIYFDSKGRFRGNNIKSRCLDFVCKLEVNMVYQKSFEFIHNQLQPFKELLFYIPSTNPQSVPVECIISEESLINFRGKEVKHPVIKRIMIKGESLLEWKHDNVDVYEKTVEKENLEGFVSSYFNIPQQRLKLILNQELPDRIKVQI